MLNQALLNKDKFSNSGREKCAKISRDTCEYNMVQFSLNKVGKNKFLSFKLTKSISIMFSILHLSEVVVLEDDIVAISALKIPTMTGLGWQVLNVFLDIILMLFFHREHLIMFLNEPGPLRLLETLRLIFQTNYVAILNTRTTLPTPYLFKGKILSSCLYIEWMLIRTIFVEFTANCGHQ